MLISCKCLNFLAFSSNSQQQLQQQQQQVAAITTTTTTTTADETGSQLAAALMRAFLHKYPRNFIFYSQCMDFFKQSIGPIADLTINGISQRDLIYSITLDIPQNGTVAQAWQLSICINCNTPLCAKRLQQQPPQQQNQPQFLVNCSLLTSNEELSRRRADKSFSDSFGLLIMDHPSNSAGAAASVGGSAAGLSPTLTPLSVSFQIGSMTTNTPLLAVDSRQQRLRQLQQHLQQRLQREIAETDERIQRYTEQQFALLKSFRVRAEQEFDLIARTLQRVPEQQAAELLDRAPPALDVLNVGIGSVSFPSRRRNTIGSRRDVSVTFADLTPTTPTIPTTLALTNVEAAATPAATAASAITQTQQSAVAAPFFSDATIPPTVTASSSATRRMSNFDTPPATPEATPMSVGNSPTFKQQQQQPSAASQPFIRLGIVNVTGNFQQQFPTPPIATAEAADDCLFELEGVDGVGGNSGTGGGVAYSMPALSPLSNYYQQQQQSSQQPASQYQRSNSLSNHHHQHHAHHHQLHHDNTMSDLDESDGAEEAEDALDLDSSMPIPMHGAKGGSGLTQAQMMNFAKSLPIEIANSPMAARSYMGESEEDEIDNNVDIAASIKALAKSVHGEAVFGDLPRPRLRSQI